MSAPAASAPSFLGTGWSFPPSFGSGGGEVAMVSDVDDVHQALRVLFATRRGERAMQESYGCSLDDAVFEEVDQQLVNHLRTLAHDAVLEHEPRIRLLDVDVSRTDDAGVLRLQLTYVILGTNSRFNMVLPFSVNEAVAPE